MPIYAGLHKNWGPQILGAVITMRKPDGKIEVLSIQPPIGYSIGHDMEYRSDAPFMRTIDMRLTFHEATITEGQATQWEPSGPSGILLPNAAIIVPNPQEVDRFGFGSIEF